MRYYLAINNGNGLADEELIAKSLEKDFRIPFKVERNPESGVKVFAVDARYKRKIKRLKALLHLKIIG